LSRRPLPNRVDPFGSLVATDARGTLFGNRGGRFHCERTQTVRGRAFASRQWICCVLTFKGRHRAVWGHGYTELFFADEATALAAGHRPCFECRRSDAAAFAAAWGRATGAATPRAPAIDVVLHRERLAGDGSKRRHAMPFATLPDGVMVAAGGAPWLVLADRLLPWSFEGYGAPVQRPVSGDADVLTPPSIVAAIHAGYRVRGLPAVAD
jgi:hypothetical protein